MAHVQTSSLAGASLGHRFDALRADISARIAKRRVYRETVSQLQALSNRDLADLGIARSMIRSIAIEAAYGA